MSTDFKKKTWFWRTYWHPETGEQRTVVESLDHNEFFEGWLLLSSLPLTEEEKKRIFGP